MLDLKQNNLKEILKTKKFCLLDFYSTYCAPCKTLEQNLIELESKFIDKILLVKINIEELPEIAKDMQIFSVPTLLIFKNEQEIKRLTGNLNKKKLEDIFTSLE